MTKRAAFLAIGLSAALAGCGTGGDDGGGSSNGDDWRITLVGAHDMQFDGRAFQHYDYPDKGMAYLKLNPRREGDQGFNFDTYLMVIFETGSLDGAGEAPVAAGDAKFNYKAEGEKGFNCQTTGPSTIKLEEYTEERIRGTYQATMDCDGEPMELGADFDVG